MTLELIISYARVLSKGVSGLIWACHFPKAEPLDGLRADNHHVEARLG